MHGRLGDPTLGQHNGLPLTVVVSTTLHDLTTATGHGITAAGTLIPMRDLIAKAARAYHYLAIYDRHSNRPLYLARARRIATADQRLMLYNSERGCTYPGVRREALVDRVEVKDLHGGSVAAGLRS